MIFITDRPSTQSKALLLENKHLPLIYKRLDGRQLARFIAPKWGWTPWDLWQVRQQIPLEWWQAGAEAYLGDALIGSTQF
ncbi:hypothetical protein KIT90_20465 [Vibrio sp. B172a]|uniref:hypothetical protein n=1 Tax=Vibrio sp. B172a TaxID=2835790 RepID=UPI0025531BBA|nr:hypothetical protein [Vibrio sp. B172a]MDK9783756.1 hypothetical protein [Vibrio sp. B172a]